MTMNEAAAARLAYDDDGEGTPLVLLHAFPLSSEMWRPQRLALRGRARVVAPDLRGFGRTPASAGPYGLHAMADDVARLLDALGIDRFVLGGLSMGGYLAFEILRRIDDARVRGLVLADTRPGADSDEARANRLAMAAQADRDGSGPAADAMVGKLLGPTSLADRPELVERVRAMIRANTGAGIANAQRAMAARPDSTSLLASLTMPTLVIVGEEDALTPPAEAEAMAACMPNACVVRIPEAGHLSNMERPDAFNDAVSQLLSRASSSV